MTIIHYIYSLDQKSGGVGTYIQLLAKELGKLTNLHIVTHSSTVPLPLENCTIHEVPPFSLFFCGKQMKRAWLQLLDEVKPDIVHVNGCWLPSMAYAGIWAKNRGFKTVLSPHGMLEPWDIKKNYWTKKLPALLLYQKKAIQSADCLIATSESERLNLLKLNYNDDIHVIPNGIAFENIHLKKSWKLRKQLFFLALLRKNKGADLLIEAVNRLREKLKGYKVIIAGTPGDGEGNYVVHLQNLIKLYHLEDIVSMPGGVYNDEKWKLYQESDFFILPTLNENFGIVIAESLLTGTPVITCKGAPWPILEKEHCGWWVDRTVESIAKAIESAISKDETELEYMGRNGRRFVEAHYGSEKVAQQFVHMYQNICDKNRK